MKTFSSVWLRAHGVDPDETAEEFSEVQIRVVLSLMSLAGVVGFVLGAIVTMILGHLFR